MTSRIGWYDDVREEVKARHANWTEKTFLFLHTKTKNQKPWADAEKAGKGLENWARSDITDCCVNRSRVYISIPRNNLHACLPTRLNTSHTNTGDTSCHPSSRPSWWRQAHLRRLASCFSVNSNGCIYTRLNQCWSSLDQSTSETYRQVYTTKHEPPSSVSL